MELECIAKRSLEDGAEVQVLHNLADPDKYWLQIEFNDKLRSSLTFPKLGRIYDKNEIEYSKEEILQIYHTTKKGEDITKLNRHYWKSLLEFKENFRGDTIDLLEKLQKKQ